MRMPLVLSLACLILTLSASLARGAEPAIMIAVEAEAFQVDRGWVIVDAVKDGQFADGGDWAPVSGGQLLSVDPADGQAAASTNINVPESGTWRLWVRYEYPPDTESRFRVTVEQVGREVGTMIMGMRRNPRWWRGDLEPRPLGEPIPVHEGFVEESIDLPNLAKGQVQVRLRALAQDASQGTLVPRRIDVVMLTNDLSNQWRSAAASPRAHAMLEAVRTAHPARWEMMIHNRSGKSADYSMKHHLARSPWQVNIGTVVKQLEAGAKSDWIPVAGQDTTASVLAVVEGSDAFTALFRPVGGTDVTSIETAHGAARVYLPPIASGSARPVAATPVIEQLVDHLAAHPITGPPARLPTVPLVFGGDAPMDAAGGYGVAYTRLYHAIGLRGYPTGAIGDIRQLTANLRAHDLEPALESRSRFIGEGFFPPSKTNLDRADEIMTSRGQKDQTLAWRYGEDLSVNRWVKWLAAEGTDLPAAWRAWLAERRPEDTSQSHWLPAWGTFAAEKLRPDTSALAANERPYLYVDSWLFLEQYGKRALADHSRAVQDRLGRDVRVGGVLTSGPYLYPELSVLDWLRGGVMDLAGFRADFVRAGYPGPMVAGFLTEHLRAGARGNARVSIEAGVPLDAPGMDGADVLRQAMTQLAHGAQSVRLGAVGLTGTSPGASISPDQAASRYATIRDLTHAVAMVEDVLPNAVATPTRIGMLVSESTFRWDWAAVAGQDGELNTTDPALRRVRLHYHIDRLGIWKALTFMGHSPDLILESDLNPVSLAPYEVLYVVGDCLPVEAANVLRHWVESGGVLMATAGAGQFDIYRQPNSAMASLLGLARRRTELTVPLGRPIWELASQRPLGRVTGDLVAMPRVAVSESVAPAHGVDVMAYFENREPALLVRYLGRGQVFYIAAAPGVSYLWSGMQPPTPHARNAAARRPRAPFDTGAASLIRLPLVTRGIRPAIAGNATMLDARLLQSGSTWIVPLVNYADAPVTPLEITIAGLRNIKRVTSARHGELTFQPGFAGLSITVPSLEIADILRIE